MEMQQTNQQEEPELKDLLQQKLNVLRKNRENISAEDLSGKYAKAYRALLGEINALCDKLILEEAFKIAVPRDFLEVSLGFITGLLYEKEFVKETRRALYEEYSAAKFTEACGKLRSILLDELFSQNYNWSTPERYTVMGERLL